MWKCFNICFDRLFVYHRVRLICESTLFQMLIQEIKGEVGTSFTHPLTKSYICWDPRPVLSRFRPLAHSVMMWYDSNPINQSNFFPTVPSRGVKVGGVLDPGTNNIHRNSLFSNCYYYFYYNLIIYLILVITIYSSIYLAIYNFSWICCDGVEVTTLFCICRSSIADIAYGWYSFVRKDSGKCIWLVIDCEIFT